MWSMRWGTCDRMSLDLEDSQCALTCWFRAAGGEAQKQMLGMWQWLRRREAKSPTGPPPTIATFVLCIILYICMLDSQLSRQVVLHLQHKHSIHLDLPSFSSSLTTKMQLNYFKEIVSGEGNRYELLAAAAQELLKKSIMDVSKIDLFATKVLRVIEQDIQVLENNEEIRRSFSLLNDKLTFTLEAVQSQQGRVQRQCRQINDKEQIINFINTTLREYLQGVANVKAEYKSTSKAHVYTTLRLDSLYDPSITNEDDYIAHYQPLLDVMHRLKAALHQLYEEIKQCEYYQLPIKSSNFLANCKHLLQQLDPFLIARDCAFNRLICYVAKGQDDNQRLIRTAIANYHAFTQDVLSDIFKSYFLAFIFRDQYKRIRDRLSEEREGLRRMCSRKVGKSISSSSSKERKLTNILLSQSNIESVVDNTFQINQKLEVILEEIRQLKECIGTGKDKIMHQYVSRKECKKGQLLRELKMSVRELQRNLLRVRKYCEVQRRYLKLKSEHDLLMNQVDNCQQEAFRVLFVKIQQQLLTLQQLDSKVQYHEEQWLNELSFQLKNSMSEFRQSCHSEQSLLLNKYKEQMRGCQVQAQHAQIVLKEVIQEVSGYLDGLIPMTAMSICNEDECCEVVKMNIAKVQKAQFMLVQSKKALDPALQQLHTDLEWLLHVYEGSMDEKIFQYHVSMFEFNAEQYLVNVGKVRELTGQLARYEKNLRRILGGAEGNGRHAKVVKMVKLRIQLYEVIADMFEEFLLIYQQTMENGVLNAVEQGVVLFDEKAFKYTLQMYQFANRLRGEQQQLTEMILPTPTINYLLDEVFQPFRDRFQSKIGLREEQLLNLTLRLQHAINLKGSITKITTLFERTMMESTAREYLSQVRKMCEEILHLKGESEKVLGLEGEEIVIHNIKEFKSLQEQLHQYEVIAKAYFSENLEDVVVSKPRLIAVKEQLIKCSIRQNK